MLLFARKGEKAEMLKSCPDITDRLVVPLPSGMWYGSGSMGLHFPSCWDVTVLRPDTPTELTPEEINSHLEHPTAQPALRSLCRGAKRPTIIIDDVNRPTPVATVLPAVLRHFADAGIAAEDVSIVLATGTHAAPRMDSVLNKVGEAAGKCRVLVHDANKQVVRLGRTRFGTPVLVNREVAASDFVIGIGGLYPNSTAGFGGGSKLVLGVLGFRSILCLHYSHRVAGRGLRREQDTFRQDLNEIAAMIGLRSLICAHVNAECKIVRMRCGDHLSYYEEERAFAQETFSVPPPGDADVVISNAYPNDLSLTFALMKGAAPLHACHPASSRILLSRCSEGLGGHGLFPAVNRGRFHGAKTYLRFASARPVPFARKAISVLSRRLRGRVPSSPRAAGPRWRNPVRLYTGPDGCQSIPADISGVKVMGSWEDVISAIRSEQAGVRTPLKVAVYPCTPLLSFASLPR